MNKKAFLSLALLVLLLTTSLPASATARQEPPPPEDLHWVFTGGPRGGIGYDLRIHPENKDIIWVTDAFAGAHQSTDGGKTWTAKNEGIDARVGLSGDAIPIFSLTIDPHNPDILWAGVQGLRGIYKSTNGGQTWVKKDNGIQDRPAMEVRGFTVDPKNSNIVYCSGNYMANPSNQDQRGFIYKTTDGGENWKLMTEPDALVRWVIIDPTDTNIVYASTGIFDRFAVTPSGVLKSLDGGETWKQINNGFNNLVVAALAMHPTDHLTLLAGTGKAAGFADEPQEINGGVFITHDGGENWQQVDPIKASGDHQIRFSAVAFAPSNPDILYADAGYIFLRSADGGKTWESYNLSASLQADFLENRGQPIALVVDPDDPYTLYMNAYDGGVFFSTDGGLSWYDSSADNSGAQVWSIAIDPTNPAYIVTASKNGPHASFDAGNNWAGRVTDNWTSSLTAVAINPVDRNHILIGRTIDARLWYTDNGGFTWTLVLGPLGEESFTGERAIQRIIFAPSAPDVVYTATAIDTKGGCVPKNTVGPGVFKSLDGGRTWVEINNGLQNTTKNIVSLAVHPENPDIAYIGELNSGVYKTTDGGQSWQPAKSGLNAKDIRALALDPHSPEILYAGSESSGVWKSEDGGGSWKNISVGMPAEATIHSIVIDPSNPNIVYAADMRTGVYRSTDQGASWQQINNGLEYLAVNDLAISEDGRTLYAATDGRGVFRLDIDGEPPEALPEKTAAEFLGLGGVPIQVDGQNQDWAGLEALYTDPAGDALEGFLDFTSGYAFTNGDSLYFMVNIVDPKGSYKQINIGLSAGSQKFLCGISPGGGTNAAMCTDVTSGYDSAIEIGMTDFSSFALGPSYQTFEARIDARDLLTTGPLQVDNIMVWTGECCEQPAWQIVDSWSPNGPIPTKDEYFAIPEEKIESETPVEGPATDTGPIKIDGNKDDWANRRVLYDDPAGDVKEGLLDLTTGYAFKTDEAIYFLIDLVNPDASFVQIDMIFSSGTQKFNCTFERNVDGAHCGDITNEPPIDIGQTQYSSTAFGPAFEGKIDFRDIRSPGDLQLEAMYVWAGECCEQPAWQEVDSWRPNGPIPSDEESLIVAEEVIEEVIVEPTTQEKATPYLLLWIVGAVLLVALLIGAWAMGRRSKR